MLTLDALRRNGAEKVYLVMPYYGYCRQDKKDGPRGAVGAKVFADIYQNLGADGIITLDIHSSAIEGFFNIAFVNIDGISVFSPMLKFLATDKKMTICSPDQGGTVRASKFAAKLETSMVTIIKKRVKPNEIHSMQLIGDVKDQDILIVDDIADTCGTLKKATEYLYDNGARSVSAIITHPVLSGKAHENLKTSGLKALYVTDTINIEEQVNSKWVKVQGENERFEYENGFKIEVISSANMLAKTIVSMCSNSSIHAINEAK
jgi:ribose-phosphate pyrophosphokinase